MNFESKKLHYKKYLYKLKIINSLSRIFRTELQRDGKLGYAKEKLEYYQSQDQNGEPITSTRFKTSVIVSKSDFNDAFYLYKTLINATDYMLRCENQSLIIYSNNRDLLLSIPKNLQTSKFEFWEPDQKAVEFLKNNTNIIIVNKKTEYPYKVTFGKKPGTVEFANWLTNNTDKVQFGSTLHGNLKRGARWIYGQYFYVRDESILFLLQIMIGDNISRIDKLVYKADIG